MITLEYNGTEQSLADWGIALDSVQCTQRNLAAHVLVFTRVGDSLATTAVFDYRGKIILRLDRTFNDISEDFEDGYVDFIGYRERHLTRSTGDFLGVTYTFSNAVGA